MYIDYIINPETLKFEKGDISIDELRSLKSDEYLEAMIDTLVMRNHGQLIKDLFQMNCEYFFGNRTQYWDSPDFVFVSKDKELLGIETKRGKPNVKEFKQFVNICGNLDTHNFTSRHKKNIAPGIQSLKIRYAGTHGQCTKATDSDITYEELSYYAFLRRKVRSNGDIPNYEIECINNKSYKRNAKFEIASEDNLLSFYKRFFGEDNVEFYKPASACWLVRDLDKIAFINFYEAEKTKLSNSTKRIVEKSQIIKYDFFRNDVLPFQYAIRFEEPINIF
jgi:hypothetical protein